MYARPRSNAITSPRMNLAQCKYCDNINKRSKNGTVLNTNHLLRDCVVLKNTVCLNCNKKGHTVSRCTVMHGTRSRNTETALVVISNTINAADDWKKSYIKRNKSRFSCLNEMEEEESKPLIKTPEPVVRKCPGAPDRASYMEALKSEAKKPSTFPAMESEFDSVKTILFRVRKHINWADATDSDDEE